MMEKELMQILRGEAPVDMDAKVIELALREFNLKQPAWVPFKMYKELKREDQQWVLWRALELVQYKPLAARV